MTKTATVHTLRMRRNSVPMASSESTEQLNISATNLFCFQYKQRARRKLDKHMALIIKFSYQKDPTQIQNGLMGRREVDQHLWLHLC